MLPKHRTQWACIAIAGFLASSTPASSRPADLVVYGRVWTGDSARPWAQAVAISGNLISEVGDSSRVAGLVGPATRVLANGRGMVVPGFMDGHTHFIYGGFQLTSVDLRDAASPAELITRLKGYAAKVRPGEWITGGDWDHERWLGTPLPERSWIDSVTPNNPVFLYRVDGHMALANSAALRLARITRDTRDIPGGTIIRGRNSEPTGILMDSGYASVADSVAPTLGNDPSAKAAWIADSTAWDAKLVTPFMARVRSGLGIQVVPGPALRARIGRILAGQTAAQRWGAEAGEDFLIANDADIGAALNEFPQLPALLQAQPNTR